jgi:hypothetical protein
MMSPRVIFGIVVAFAFLGLLIAWAAGAFKSDDKKKCDDPSDTEKQVAGGDNVLTFVFDTDSGNCVANTCVIGYTPQDGICVTDVSGDTPSETVGVSLSDYEDKGAYRIRGNAGWGSGLRVNKTLNDCLSLCNNNSDCKGFSSYPIRSGPDAGKMGCITYSNSDMNTSAINYETCKDDPWDTVACRESIENAKLYKKNKS